MSWTPVNADHAIERVLFTTLFSDQLPTKVMSQLGVELGAKASSVGINEMVQLSPPPFPIHFDGAVQQQPQMPNFGQVYRKTSNGIVLEEINCTAMSLSFSATLYVHWKDFLERVEECLAEAINRVAEVTDIVDVRLEYWDKFNLPHGNTAADVKSLVNPASRLIPGYFKEQKGSWHTHFGFFTPDHNSNSRRVLVNGNVDVAANVDGFPSMFEPDIYAQARVHTLAATQHTVPNQSFDSWDVIKSVANHEHDLLKSVMADCIHSDLVKAINLNANPFEL